MEIKENISLKNYNTFGIDARARYFVSFETLDDLQFITHDSRFTTYEQMILGGGSNILFVEDYPGIILKNELKGIEKLNEDKDHIYVKVGAGENWHQFVMHCVENNWAGIENLSLIPGNTGAAPMQNIGAYGVELKDHFWELEAYHLQEKLIHKFSLSDCEFGYRDSIFKRKYKDEFAILSVSFRLNKKPVYHTSYGNLQQELEKMGIQELSIKSISQAVINIRSSKLPDPKLIGNAGSFFKNPSTTADHFKTLKIKFPGIVGYDNPDGSVKLAAGWLIEHSGPGDSRSWKGYREGDAGCHAKQALVLVNYGNARGKEIFDLSEKIRASVKEKFTIDLEREVNII